MIKIIRLVFNNFWIVGKSFYSNALKWTVLLLASSATLAQRNSHQNASFPHIELTQSTDSYATINDYFSLQWVP